MTDTKFHQRAQQLLMALAGEDAELRADQSEAINALVNENRRVLVVQRTGWGKSAVYFVAAKLLREQGRGPTILVSPLLALMRDQLVAATRMGLVAETINSSNMDEWSSIEDLIAHDKVDLVAISPERLNNPKFVQEILPFLTASVGLVVIDEAHCISQWGHDFRPDYLRIRDALARISPDTPVLATTATATNWVIDDVAHQLGAEPLTLRGTLDRSSLQLSVVELESAAERLAWLAEQVPQMIGSGIVYCLTQAAAEQTASWFRSQGINAAAYTGSTEVKERERLEHALRNNEIKVLTATSALGMGFDKPDLAFAVNLGAPSSITAYYQMVGRAGRALDKAEGVMLPGSDDKRIWNWFEQVSFPPQVLAESVVNTLSIETPMSEAAIEALVDIRRTRLTALLKVLDVEGAVTRRKGGWVRTANEWQYNQERYDRVRAARKLDQDQVLEYQSTSDCRMAFLRRALDDPSVSSDWSCGRCDRCTAAQVATPSPLVVAAADAFSRNIDVYIQARKMWPAGVVDRKGKIAAEHQALDGRALCEMGTPGWNEIVNDVLAQDDEPPGEMIAACGNVLKRWSWPEGRPTWITWIPSTVRPKLSRAIAEELGRIGKLPVHESLRRIEARKPQSEMNNSAHACENVVGAFEVLPDIPDGPVLLIDDSAQSGWTITVVAHQLRAKCGPVYPFVLQKR